MNELYESVARLCREKDISVSALCSQAGVSAGILSDLKNGRKKGVSSETLSKLARALGVPADTLLGAQSAPAPDPLIACYGEVAPYLDEQDLRDMITFMRMRAEMKKARDKK